MPVLNGSHVNPSLVKDPIGRKELNTDATRQQRKVLEEAFEKWKDFMGSPIGVICARLADPKIVQLDNLLSLTLAYLRKHYGWTTEESEEMRSTWRGEKKVWWELKTEGNKLKKQLEELEKEGGEAEDSGPGWTAPPKEKAETS